MTRYVYVLPAGRFRWEVRVPKWEPVEPGTMIPAGTPFRVEYDDGGRTTAMEHVNKDRDEMVPDGAHWFIESTESVFYRLKSRAMDAARAIAILIGGEVQPHDRRGRIQDPDSYGNDPRESHG